MREKSCSGMMAMLPMQKKFTISRLMKVVKEWEIQQNAGLFPCHCRPR